LDYYLTFICSFPPKERKNSLLQNSHPKEKRMIIMFKTPGSQVGSPAAAETRGEVRGWGVVESGQ